MTFIAGPEVWLAARLAAGLPAETWKPMPRIDGCAFSWYEASDTGNAVQVMDRRGRNGRLYPAGPVKTRPHVQGGYILADFRCDDPDTCRRHGRHTFTMHKVVLATFAGPRPRRMQGSHLSLNPAWNWWPEGLAYEDQPANERRKPVATRVAAARKARAARLAPPPPPVPWWRTALRHLPWSNAKRKTSRITAGSKAISKPVTKEAA